MNPIEVTEPAVLIRITKAFGGSMSADELYNTVRGRWNINVENARKAEYAIIMHAGIVKEVYKIDYWQAATKDSGLNISGDFSGRYEFVGTVAPAEIRKKYVRKSLKHYFLRGNMHPTKLVNIH